MNEVRHSFSESAVIEAAHTHLQSHSEGVGLGATVPHVGLDELKDVHCLLLYRAV